MCSKLFGLTALIFTGFVMTSCSEMMPSPPPPMPPCAVSEGMILPAPVGTPTPMLGSQPMPRVGEVLPLKD